jgi:hypothetical protein
MVSGKFKIFIKDRTYKEWTFSHVENNVNIDIDEYPVLRNVDPVSQKVFSRDVFEIVDAECGYNVKKVFSTVETCQYMAGILVLEHNKTYGRTENKKRLLYKCIPDDTYLPIFLVPYEVKLGFSKVQKNKYVVFRFDHWTDKHPRGLITETIGDVDILVVSKNPKKVFDFFVNLDGVEKVWGQGGTKASIRMHEVSQIYTAKQTSELAELLKKFALREINRAEIESSKRSRILKLNYGFLNKLIYFRFKYRKRF